VADQDVVARALFIRLYTDEMIPAWMAPTLRANGFDALSAHEAGLLGAADEEQLQHSTQDGRVLFTCNVGDRRHHFQAMHTEWLSAGREHAGILLCPQELVSRNPFAVLERLQRFLDTKSAEEMHGQLLWLP
jgi:hypothetical protein